MSKQRHTNAKVASAAAKILTDPNSTRLEKKVAASALSQRAPLGKSPSITRNA